MSGEDSAASEMPNLSGNYELVRNENLDAFLEANGANWLIRKMVSTSSPKLEITQDGNKMNIRLHSMVINRVTEFTVGEDFDETQQDGSEMRVTPLWDGKKLVLKYVPKKEGVGKPQTHTRELDGEELILSLQVENVTAKRYFKKTA